MEQFSLRKMLRERGRTAAIIVLGVIAVGLVIMVVQPFQYRASTSFLVVERSTGGTAYDAIRSAERVNTSVARLVTTSSFAEVVLSGAGVGGRYPVDPEDRREAWEETVTATVVPETGILRLDFYSTDRVAALALAQTAAAALPTVIADYAGSTNVSARVVDTAYVSHSIARPNIPVGVAASVVVGLLLGFGYLVAMARFTDGLFTAQAPSPTEAMAMPVRVTVMPREHQTPATPARPVQQQKKEVTPVMPDKKPSPAPTLPNVAAPVVEAVAIPTVVQEPVMPAPTAAVSEPTTDDDQLDTWGQLWRSALATQRDQNE